MWRYLATKQQLLLPPLLPLLLLQLAVTMQRTESLRIVRDAEELPAVAVDVDYYVTLNASMMSPAEAVSSSTMKPSTRPASATDSGHKIPCTAAEERRIGCSVHGDCFVLEIVARTSFCICHRGWTDSRCYTKTMSDHIWEHPLTANLSLWIAIAVVVPLVLLIIIVFAVCLISRRRREKQRSVTTGLLDSK